MSGTQEFEDVTTERGGWIFPSPWVGVATLFAAIGAAAMVYVFTVPPDNVPTAVAGSAVGLGVFAAGAIAWDAYNRTGGSWSPIPLLWALPMLVPGLNLGVVLAYTWRYLVTSRREFRGLWVWPAVGANILSGVALYTLVVLEATTLPLSLPIATLQIANYVFIAIATVAAYYDTRYVERRLDGNGENWLFGGYHWVLLLSVPLPIRILLALVYAGRRRMLLRNLPPIPGEPPTVDPDDKA